MSNGSCGAWSTASVCTVTTDGATFATASVIALLPALRDLVVGADATTPDDCAADRSGAREQPIATRTATNAARRRRRQMVIAVAMHHHALDVELARIPHGVEKQRVRRRGRRHLAVVGGREQTRDVAERPPTGGDVEHRADEESDHVMQESVGFDLEHQPAWPIAPPRVAHATAVIVMGRRRARYGEGPEAMLALERGRPPHPERRAVEGLPERQLVPTTKRRVRFLVRADVVAVPSADSRCSAREIRPASRRRSRPTRRREEPRSMPAAASARAAHRSGTRTPTAWPRACTPASVRPDPSAATGAAHNRSSASSTTP